MPISPELQLERRKNILAKTREMIATQGVDNITIRDLAEHCGVSVPTLYNQFDNKDNLVFAAADEIVRYQFEKLSMPSGKRGLDHIIEVNTQSVNLTLKNPELMSLIAINVPRSNNSLAVAQSIYTQALQEMQDNGELVDWVDINFVGKRLHRRIRSVTIDWSRKQIGDDELLHYRFCEIYLMILGLSTGKIRSRVEQLLKKEIAKIRKKEIAKIRKKEIAKIRKKEKAR